MKKPDKIGNEYKCLPFWSWNDELDEGELVKQIEWMKESGVGGFFMHARGGLKTEYLSEKWFSCVSACLEAAEKYGMEAYAYDENGWPSGFAGGKLLEDGENRDKYLSYSTGAYDASALVSYDLSGAELKRVSSGKNCLNVFEHTSVSTADILNGEVVDKFIALTHEEYKKRDTGALRGFFTDEPQYYRWGMPYTRVLPGYFKEAYGLDILDGLGLLFVEKEGYRAFRYKYWKSMQTLMLNNFAKKIYNWCDSNGYKLTGHYLEEASLAGQMMCCAGIMPFYEFMHIPGIDCLCREYIADLAPRQLGSVAAQLGKKQTLTETFALCGWDVTPGELKKIAEIQYAGGVNLMCQHLLPYSEHGQRKRDYPPHFSAINPWVKEDFSGFNDYFSRLGHLLANSSEVVSVGVLHPMTSSYLYFKKYEPDGGAEFAALDLALAGLVKQLSAKQIPYHFIDETILARHGRVEGGKLICGQIAYDYIILPKLYSIDNTTAEFLKEYLSGGGKLCAAGNTPEYIEGEPADLSFLRSNISLNEILAAQAFYTEENAELRTSLRRDGEGRLFLYAVNLGGDCEISFKIKGAKGFECLDLLSGRTETVGGRVGFADGQSRIMYLTNNPPPQPKPQLSPLYLGKNFTVCGAVENWLTLDFIRFSTDGREYSEPLHHMGVFNELLERRYKGSVYLKYEFTAEVVPERVRMTVEDMNVLSVTVNGSAAEKTGVSDLDIGMTDYNIAAHVKRGANEAVILIDYFQHERVYYALFGENVTESLKNCLAYDTAVEPIYLRGGFGVAGDFSPGKDDTVIIGNNFRLTEQKKEITSLIQNGFPFLAGNITLRQRLTVDDTDKELIINGRFHLMSVRVNGSYAGRLMFTNRLDLSGYLKKGENELEITLTVGNRNAFGPFHTPAQEDFVVAPQTFERLNTWKNGKSSALRETYSFVKTII